MAHVARRRRGGAVYASIEESYRDERGRPRKRILKWLGRVSDTIVLNLRSEPGAKAWDEWERGQLEVYEREQVSYREALERLPEGLHTGPTDPIAPPQSIEAPQGGETPADEPAVDAPASEGTEGSDTSEGGAQEGGA